MHTCIACMHGCTCLSKIKRTSCHALTNYTYTTHAWTSVITVSDKLISTTRRVGSIESALLLTYFPRSSPRIYCWLNECRGSVFLLAVISYTHTHETAAKQEHAEVHKHTVRSRRSLVSEMPFRRK